ncbi:protein VASCULATURE COMPLEXITY AND CONNECTIVITY isoform X1 [Gastrolobium bilobum]|uniref:protein VASCULATURE COMPLEXITY AND CONNECTIVITY isoform X1 n=1 Tax=Gastrolobium bilobum TaxID=150636 RepID=UPI002AB2A238|nr:protein VASCULATURE COMPLEXITY AND CONNECTIVITY isoform X1 [Gastrolobium bilobum]
MERKVMVVCCVVGFLGLLSAATSFGAEATRIKTSQVQFITPIQCMYPRSPALPLGLTAALALMLSQVVINVSTGCICCRKSHRIPDSNWRVALVCFVLSWFTFVIAFLLLLTGAALNDSRGEESVYFGNYYCYVVKPGVFAGGAILSLASVAFGIVYYITLTEGKNGSNPFGDSSYPNQGAIAMGQPQIPPQTSQNPVFVHEDTYMRRQFT